MRDSEIDFVRDQIHLSKPFFWEVWGLEENRYCCRLCDRAKIRKENVTAVNPTKDAIL